MALIQMPDADTGWLPMNTFGARLALIRQRMGWNTTEAAAACGLNDQSWRNWEKEGGVRDFPQVCAKIAAATGCSLGWLMHGGQPPDHRHWKQMMPPDLRVHAGGGKSNGQRALLHRIRD